MASTEPISANSILGRVMDICESGSSPDAWAVTGELVADLIECDDVRYQRLLDGDQGSPGRVWLRAGRGSSPDRFLADDTLCLLTRLQADDPFGWVLWRKGRRFTTTDLDRSRQALPLLIALDRHLGVVPRALPSSSPPNPSSSPPNLTARERAVLKLIADGLTATAAARRLAVAPSTIRKHLEHAYAKLGDHDRLAAVIHAQQLGLI